MAELISAVMLDTCGDAMFDNEDVMSAIETDGSGMLQKAVSHFHMNHNSSG